MCLSTRAAQLETLQEILRQRKEMGELPAAELVMPDEIAAEHRARAHAGFEHARSMGVQPTLVAVMASDNESAKIYAEWTQKACEEDGVDFRVLERRKEDVEETVQELCADTNVHGVMIYYPCFGAAPSWHGSSMDDFLRDSLPIEKDVEGLCHTYRHLLYHNTRYVQTQAAGDESAVRRRKCLLPCTPLAVVKILEALHMYDANLPVGERLQGRSVTIVNRSEVVGRPLAAMLSNDGASVYSIDLNDIQLLVRGAHPVAVTESIEAVVRRSHVVILGVPSESYRLPPAWVTPGSVVVNVSSYSNVDEEELMRVPGVRYVPLVGKVTVAMLELNLLRLLSNFHLPNLGDLCL